MTDASFIAFAKRYLHEEAAKRGMAPPLKPSFVAEMVLIANKKWKRGER